MKCTRKIFTAISASVLIFTSSLAAPTTARVNSKPFTLVQEKSIEKIIYRYLMNNPEILIEVSQKLEKKLRADAQKKQKNIEKTISSVKNQLFDNQHDPIVGNPKGNLVIVEFFDYQCSHCKNANKTIQNLMTQDPDLKVIYKDWPIFGGSSLAAAQATIAANKQGKYLALHEALFNNSSSLTSETIMSIATSVGLDIAQLKKDMESPETKAILADNDELAKKLGLQGTPAFILTTLAQKDFKFIPGEAKEEDFKSLLSQLKG